MTVLGRFSGVLPDEISFWEDTYKQEMGGIVPTTGTSPSLYRDNFSRLLCNADTASSADGVMNSVPLYLRKGDVVTSLSFCTGATEVHGPTNWWFALYDVDGALLEQTDDQLATAWAASTVKTLDLQDAVTVTESGFHWAAIMVHVAGGGAHAPTLVGRSVAIAAAADLWLTGEVHLAQTSGAGLTTTAPATIAAPTVSFLIPRVIAT